MAGVALCWSAAAHAIVNIESLQAGEPEPGYSGSVNVSVDNQTGNTRQFNAATGLRLQWHGGPDTNFGILRYHYATASGIENTNVLFSHLRHIHQVTATVAYEGFLQAQRNRFTRMAFRGLAGGGARLTLAQRPGAGRMHLGVGAFYSLESWADRAGAGDSGVHRYWRINSYLNYVRQINPQVAVVTTTYWQPWVRDLGNFRLLEEATLSVKMSDALALTLTLDVAHNNRPPQTVRATDTIVSTGLNYSF